MVGNAGDPRIVISVVHWQGVGDLLRCLRALRASTYRDYDIVIIDNDARDDGIAQALSLHPGLHVLRNPSNLGFAGGHARAIAYAKAIDADAVWLVNADARPEPEALGELVTAWRREGDGIYGALTLFRDEHGQAWIDAPAKFLSPRYRPGAWRRDRPLPSGAIAPMADAMTVGAVVGTAMLLPMSVIAAHGELSHAWFMYCEEIDYALRLRAAGVVCRLVPRARVWHRGAGSQHGGVADLMQYYHARNEILLARRHGVAGTASLVAVKKCARAVMTMLRRPQRACWILAGTIDALRGRTGKVHAPEQVSPAAARPPQASGGSPWRRLRAAVIALRAALHRPDWRTRRIGASTIVFDRRYPVHVRAYHDYCVELFAESLRGESVPKQLVFDDHVRFDRPADGARRIGFQFEHTLVRPGGRDSTGAEVSTLPTGLGDERYLLRVAEAERLRCLDAVIEYSGPNLAHIGRSAAQAALAARMLLIAPLLHAPDFGAARPDGDVITLFADTGQSRRQQFLDEARAWGLPIRNIQRCYAVDALRRQYADTRVLVNVHQTDHHHTLEELRVLPALLSGVIVVSEDSPLRDRVPYADFIVWASYERLVETLDAVLADYAGHYRRIFGGGALSRVLETLRTRNAAEVARTLRRFDG